MTGERNEIGLAIIGCGTIGRIRAEIARDYPGPVAADNTGIGQQLAAYEVLYGDWRELFRSVDRIELVTKEDIQRVARAAFNPVNRTVAMIVNAAASETAGSGDPDSNEG